GRPYSLGAGGERPMTEAKGTGTGALHYLALRQPPEAALGLGQLGQFQTNQSLFVALGRSERRLGRRQPRHRHAEGRAADVVQPDLVAEGDAVRVAAVLATDADLQLGV